MSSQTPPRRIALITGAAKGIGAAIADKLAQDGMHVLIGDIDDAQAQAKAAELVRAGHAASALNLNVGKADAVAAAFDAIDRQWGR